MNHSLTPIKALGALTALGIAVALAGCDGKATLGSGGSKTGEVSMDITDAPTDQFSEVNIVFTGIVLKPADGEEIEFTFEEPRELDLLSLQGGETATLLDSEEVAAGRYSWVRLTLDVDQSHVMENGQQKTLFIPSGAQTGLKLVSGFTVAADGSNRFTIDFDVRKSIVDPQGNPQGADYFLKPTLRLVDNQEVGAIAGNVDASTVIQTQCANVSEYTGMVYVFEGFNAVLDDLGSNNEPLMAVPVSDDRVPGDYDYKAAFLTEGNYTVSYSCTPDDNDLNEPLNFEESQNVSVEANATARVDFE